MIYIGYVIYRVCYIGYVIYIYQTQKVEKKKKYSQIIIESI